MAFGKTPPSTVRARARPRRCPFDSLAPGPERSPALPTCKKLALLGYWVARPGFVPADTTHRPETKPMQRRGAKLFESRQVIGEILVSLYFRARPYSGKTLSQAVSAASRSTLARIDAAAMEKHNESPWIKAFCGRSRSRCNASTRR